MKKILSLVLLLSILMPVQKAQSALIFTNGFGLVVFSAGAGVISGMGIAEKNRMLIIAGIAVFILGTREVQLMASKVPKTCWKVGGKKNFYYDLTGAPVDLEIVDGNNVAVDKNNAYPMDKYLEPNCLN